MPAKFTLFWNLMAGQRLRYGAAIVALLAATLVYNLVPLITKVTVDHIIQGKALTAPWPMPVIVQAVGGRSVIIHNLWLAGLGIVFLGAFSAVFNYLKGRWSAIASESIARNVRNRLYDHLQHLPCSYHDKAETGDLVQRCTSDVETIRQFLATQVVEMARTLVLLMVIIPTMLLLSVPLTAVAVCMILPIFLYAFVFFKRIKSAFKLSDEAEGKMTSVLQENLTGIRVVRAFARQEFEKRKFAGKNARYRDRTIRLITYMAWFWSVSDYMVHVQRGLILIFAAFWIIKGYATVGTLVAFMAYIDMISWPLRQMGRILSELGKAQVSLDRVYAILNEPAESAPVQKAQVDSQEPLAGAISFRDLSFSYNNDGQVLGGISFDVPAGATVAILGPSGSGKSTLVHLLLRMYDYSSGSIQIDGIEINQLDRQAVRKHVGVVMQDPFLYSKTLRENIKIARWHAGDEEVIEAAQMACIHDSIVGFEKGYDTLVGERGVTLSGGQRQRVALARAILKDPPILILDDALSAVDTRTEAMILDALASRHGRRTTLVIAHRLSTLMNADRIIVLDAGQIVQSGTHQALLKENGLYRRLWQIQSSLQEDLDKEIATRHLSTSDAGLPLADR